MTEVFEFLQKAGICFLATDAAGQPHAYPFSAMCIYGTRMYIQSSLKNEAAQQMLANPKIAITAMVGEDWIRIRANAVYDQDPQAQQAMLEANPELKKDHKAGDGSTAVFYLDGAVATFCSFTKDQRVILF